MELLDLCHKAGMRLVVPENELEVEFLSAFSQQQLISGLPFLYTVAATDVLSRDCSKGNAEFRLFYSGEKVTGPQLSGEHWRYQCIFLTPGGLYNRDCDGGWSPLMCELRKE